jgi:glycosyltransferase involved in cell wall biosynthesis
LVPDGQALPWPLSYIVDEHGVDTGFAILRGGLGRGDRPAFRQMAAEHHFVGFAQLGPFPLYHEGYDSRSVWKDPTDGWGRPEVEACEAWCHCFRDPDRYIPPGPPRFLMSSGSDFIDPEHVGRLAECQPSPVKRWDVIYCCLPNWFNEMQKNWELARSCIARLVTELNLHVLLIGRLGAADVPRHPNIELRPQVSWTELLYCTARCNLAFIPNELDASPRVLTEALALDVPVLVNADILGGWKYVNDETGQFFVDESDVVAAAERCLGASVRPRAWYLEHYGPTRSGARLAAHLRTLGASPALTYARPANTVKPT